MRRSVPLGLSKWHHETHVSEQRGGLEACLCKAPRPPRCPAATAGHPAMARQEHSEKVSVAFKHVDAPLQQSRVVLQRQENRGFPWDREPT